LKNRFVHIAWFVLLISGAIPLLQQWTELLPVTPLGGAITLSSKPDWEASDWLDGSFQNNFEKYSKDNFGLRASAIRLNNQLDYSLFDELNAKSVVIGKENYLYEENYIRCYLGMDFLGEEVIKERLFKLKKVADHLKTMGKDLIVVYAAGKGTYFPEYFPSSYDSIVPGKTNFDSYVRNTRELGIPFIDFNSLFVKMKDTTRYPLFPKCGIHWSKYAELLVADSIVSYIEDLRSIDMNHIIIDEVKWRSTNRDTDYDLGRGLNLVLELDTYPMAYPEFHIENKPEAKKPKMLFVADSYFWGIFNRGFSSSLFGGGQFWYYNQGIYPDSYENPISVSEIDFQKSIESNDVVVLLYTDANLSKFAYGFVDQAYELYFKLNK